ncbi:MAG: TetR/AcrR family transcriptional regulator [Chloroflexi bacterium]|nr:MAG: TetR/AcrR family transcriptional regulator [Chloroflexota bacterium]
MATRAAPHPPGAVSEKRRQQLVLAAYREIAERGFEGLRTREVAAEVGVNIATLHYYFPTKESLIRAVLDHAMGRFRTTLAPHGSPADQLRNYLRATRKLMLDEPELGAVMAELALRSIRDDSIGSILNEMYDVWHVTLRGLLRRAVKEGKLRPEADSDAVAALIIATLTAMTLPVMSDARRGDQALRQLERWLGIPGSRF